MPWRPGEVVGFALEVEGAATNRVGLLVSATDTHLTVPVQCASGASHDAAGEGAPSPVDALSPAAGAAATAAASSSLAPGKTSWPSGPICAGTRAGLATALPVAVIVDEVDAMGIDDVMKQVVSLASPVAKYAMVSISLAGTITIMSL